MQQYALWAVFNGMPFAMAVLLGLALPLFVLMLARRFEAGVVFVCIVFVLDAAILEGGSLYLGINVHGADLGFGVLAIAAAARWLFVHGRAERPARPRAFVLLVLMVALGIGIGLVTEGRRAGVQGREAFYALACAGWAMSFAVGERQLRNLLHALAATCLALLLLSAYRWMAYFWPLPDLLPPGGQWSPDVATRVIASHETLLLAQWLVLGLVFGARHTGALALGRWLAPLLLAAVVALQHRSVWIAALVGGLAALAVSRRAQQSRPLQLATLLAAVAVVLVPLVLSERLAPLSREIGQSASHAAAGQGTVHARLSDWRREIGEFARESPHVWLIGRGYGRDTSRFHITESGERRVVRFGLHNQYLSLLVHHGVIGLGAYLALLVGAALALWRVVNGAARPGPRARAALRGGSGRPAKPVQLEGALPHDPASWQAPALLVLLAMQAAYHLPYSSDPMQHLLLGVAWAYVATRRMTVVPSVTPAATTPAAPAAGRAAHDVAWR